MSRRASSILLLVSAVLLTGCRSTPSPFDCTDAIGCVDIPAGTPVEIGVLQVLSGDLAPFGESALRSIELAKDDLDGQILGHPIVLRAEDSLCSKEGGATAASKITADPQVVAILGPTCSGAAEAAIKVVSEAGFVMVSGSCSAPPLTSVGGEPGAAWWPGFFRTAQNDAQSGWAAAAFAFQELGITQAATIDDGDPYTQGLAHTFQLALAELGGEVTIVAGVNKGDTDMRPVLTAVGRSGAELLYLPVFSPEGDRLVQQGREMEELENITFMSAEALYLETFVEEVGEAGVGLYLVVPSQPSGPAHNDFASRYQVTYGEQPSTSYYAHWYDAAGMLFDAIQAVAVRDTAGGFHVGRQALRDALYATSSYHGLTGTLTCDQYGDCGVARFEILRLDDPSYGLEGLASNVVYTYPPGN